MMRRRLLFFLILACTFAILYFILNIKFINEKGTNIADVHESFHVKHKSENAFDSIQKDNVSSANRLLKVEEVPMVKINEINCKSLFEEDALEQKKALNLIDKLPAKSYSDDAFVQMTRDCESFIRMRSYIMKPVSDEEYNFPIAFSILIYKDFQQFERLLRAVYRPQNLYCIHVEKKSPGLFHEAVKRLANCFENVFVAPVSISVEWGYYSVLEPELICMEELWKRSKKWKYFINLTGQEFPLKTNGDIVKILTVFNGANNMEGTVLRQNPVLQRYLSNSPFGMTVTKGSVHITASRGFVDYILHNSTALEFRNWIKEKPVPDELFFSSMNFNPQLGVPGSYRGVPETDTRKNLFITRFKNWGMWPFVWPCAGNWVRQICIFGIGDMSLLASRPELFANKFFLDYQPLTLDCMEERHYNLTRDEVLGKRKLDLNFYRDLDFVRNHV